MKLLNSWLLVAILVGLLNKTVFSFPAHRTIDLSNELVSEDAEADDQYDESDVKGDEYNKKDEIAREGSGSSSEATKKAAVVPKDLTAAVVKPVIKKKEKFAKKNGVAQKNIIGINDNPDSDESNPGSGEEDDDTPKKDDIESDSENGSGSAMDSVESNEEKSKVSKEDDSESNKAADSDEEGDSETGDEKANDEENTSNYENDSDEDAETKKGDIASANEEDEEENSEKRTGVNKRDGCCGCGDDEHEDCCHHCHEHEGGCHEGCCCGHEHGHHHGHHEHDDCCHHHGHHHGFVHEWGQECCGEHHGHECCGHHEHGHHHEGEHEHECCHHHNDCCGHHEEEDHPCCCCGGGGGGNGGGGGGGGGGDGDDTCRICKQSGHFARDCPDKPERDDKCRRCQQSGHFAKDCDQEQVLDPDRPPPVTYIPPEPTELEEELFQTIAQGINFSNYDNIPVEVTGPGTIPAAIRDFAEANLPETILKNIEKAKYTKPTPVQKYALPIIKADRDLMSCAQTGSGKTAAFLLPVISKLLEHQSEFTSQLSEVQAPLALIIAPTRELANQIYLEARKFALNTSLRAVVVYGGVSVAHQLRQVQSGCHLLVGTPGRLKDFIGKRKISLEKLKYLILDEADRMLDMGFMPDVKNLIYENSMPDKENRHTLMFSATFPEEIQKLAAEFLHEYVFLTIGKVGSTHSDIEQQVMEVDDASKRDKLVEILGNEGGNRNLVFVQTKRLADFLASYLCQNGFPTTSIHGDRFQEQREEALREFRSGQQTVLIATAVAARGLDIANVKQVVNYDLPDEIEEYIHRIGRTGRIGNKGKAISFFSRGRDEQLARALVKTLFDSEQVVPDWLEEAAEKALGTGYGPKGGKFGSKDTRSRGDVGGDGGGRFNAASTDDGWDKNGASNGVSGGGGGGGGGDGGGDNDEEWD